jgi:hypothetical protein
MIGFDRARALLLIGSLAAIAALLIWLRAAERADDRANQDIGGGLQREADLKITLERTETADAARTEIRDDRGSARFDQCLRTARTPANCERFLPGGEADHR